MKINIIPTTKLALLSAAFCAVMLALSPNASALTFGDANDLGSITPPEPASGPDEEHYINTLLPLSPGPHVINENGTLRTYTRTLNSCGTCPVAVFDQKNDNPVNNNGTTSINLGSGGFTYLLAKYDGPNGVDEVWNVQGMTGVVTIPFFFGQYGLSHWSLFSGNGAVPDGGTTVMLLGAALGALGMVRRRLKS